ncbi:hypothetical protein, partial [Enterococcus casseliflavus]|uniref:hypothetical protein n=1 Tax=Enterococcus casseliflavus TaxID=37734 RepID=UPI003D0F8E1B
VSEALVFAETPAQRYRALSMQALNLAFNAEYPAAAAAVTEARSLFAEQGWQIEDTSQGLLLGDALIAVSRVDSARMRSVADEIGSAQPD